MARLTELRITNFKRVKAFRLRPNGLTTIGGANGQGKTSVLNALWILFAGKSAVPPKPVREGEHTCTIAGEVSEGGAVQYRVTRTIVDGAMTLKIERGDGSPITRKPESILRELLGDGDIQFDPLAWTRAPARTQFEAIRRLVPEFDFEAAASRRQSLYDQRTDLNRQAKAERSRASGVEVPPGPRPKPIDTRVSLDALQEAVAHNGRVANAQAEIGRKKQRVAQIKAELADLEMAISDLEEGLDEAVDVEAIRQSIAKTDKVRDVIARWENKDRYEKEADRLEFEAAMLTAKIDEIDSARAAAIDGAEIGIDGLSIGDGEVLLNGMPFTQAGTREKLVAAVGVAIRLNPALRVITIDEGSEIDSQGLEVLADLAEKNEFDMILCRVDERGESDITIHDGEQA